MIYTYRYKYFLNNFYGTNKVFNWVEISNQIENLNFQNFLIKVNNHIDYYQFYTDP